MKLDKAVLDNPPPFLPPPSQCSLGPMRIDSAIQDQSKFSIYRRSKCSIEPLSKTISMLFQVSIATYGSPRMSTFSRRLERPHKTKHRSGLRGHNMSTPTSKKTAINVDSMLRLLTDGEKTGNKRIVGQRIDNYARLQC
ncbi:hypothetical protein RRG08_062274 [Elysia crispata]|uniref:Uncharacterized protein n=1 Tax=Elysia crispata TaxID=231223 RepID=A0AAE0YGE8_9GAST|nr:hypothetical protein RRG08_062274 [Elysia crispata]